MVGAALRFPTRQPIECSTRGLLVKPNHFWDIPTRDVSLATDRVRGSKLDATFRAVQSGLSGFGFRAGNVD